MTIRGPAIVTPGGQQTSGDYTRHSFSYVIPTGEAGAGATVSIQLLGEYLAQRRIERAGVRFRRWRSQRNAFLIIARPHRHAAAAARLEQVIRNGDIRGHLLAVALIAIERRHETVEHPIGVCRITGRNDTRKSLGSLERAPRQLGQHRRRRNEKLVVVVRLVPQIGLA